MADRLADHPRARRTGPAQAVADPSPRVRPAAGTTDPRPTRSTRPVIPALAARTPRPRPRIDPRIRQRRIDVRRQAGRRRLRVLIGCTGALVAVALIVGSLRSPIFAVRHVRVSGAQHVGPSQVIDAAGLVGAHQMIDVTGGRRGRAVEALAWVRRAEVRREWPATVHITVTERVPVALVERAAGAAMVDDTGRILADGGLAAHLPSVSVSSSTGPIGGEGPPGAVLPPSFGPALAVAAGMPAALNPHVDAIVATEGGVRLRLVGGGTVWLGSGDRLSDKLVAVLTLVERGRVGSGSLDVAVPSAPVLTTGPSIGNFSTRTGG
ncbi:MAG: FtsQ-type POTRA domain-containing protein [Acidimicrobiales bacterium]